LSTETIPVPFQKTTQKTTFLTTKIIETAAHPNRDRAWLVWQGTFFCLISTFFYGFSNIILRGLTGIHLNPNWILFHKELICVGCILPIILTLVLLGKYHWPHWKFVFCITIGAVICEMIGAPLHLWAFKTIGIIASVPLIQASNLIVATVIGFFFLREKLHFRGYVAIAVLTVSMICLVFGPSPTQTEKITLSVSTWLLIAGGIAAIIAGSSYSLHVVFLRYASESRQMPITLIMVIVTGIGAAIFGSLLWHQEGFDGFYRNIPQNAWKWIIVTGLFNTIGFYFQALGLRYTIVARAQLIAAAQIVFITLVGIFYFDEATNMLVWLGVTLTILGVLIISKPMESETF